MLAYFVPQSSTKARDVMWISLLAIASISCVLYIIGIALPNWTEFEVKWTYPSPGTTMTRNTGLFVSCKEVSACRRLSSAVG